MKSCNARNIVPTEQTNRERKLIIDTLSPFPFTMIYLSVSKATVSFRFHMNYEFYKKK